MHLLVWLHFATALWLLWELKEQTIAARATRFMRIHERAIDPTRAATDDEMGEYAANLTKAYQPFRKHSLLFGSRWPVEWFDERFVQLTLALDGRNTSAVSSKDAFLFAARKKGWLLLETEGVYSFPMFSQEFCKIFLEEVDNYDESGLPAPRPNSMNNYGIIVNLIGMKTMVDSLQQTLLQPLAALLFPGAGDEFNRHHAFMVRYKPHEDLGLDMHTDDSDVTFNICLGRNFTGAGLTFCGRSRSPEHRQFQHRYQHVRGRAIVHLGTQRHGADDITHGERNNLIVWNTNLAHRRREAKQREEYHLTHPEGATGYAKELGPPDSRCLSYTHDRDFTAFRDMPAEKAKHAQRAWCPPEHACYDGMAPVGNTVGRV